MPGAQDDWEGVPQELHDIWADMDDEARSNALLEYHRAINKMPGKHNESDLYTEEQLENHRRKEFSNTEHYLDLTSIAHQELVDLAKKDLLELGKLAKLTYMQYLAWELYISGVPQSDIARDLDVTRQRVHRLIIACISRVEGAMVSYPYYGWLWVYWQEIKRRHKKGSGGSS